MTSEEFEIPVELNKAARQQLQDWMRSGVVDFDKNVDAISIVVEGEVNEVDEEPTASQPPKTEPTKQTKPSPPTPAKPPEKRRAEAAKPVIPVPQNTTHEKVVLSGTTPHEQLEELKSCVANCTRCPDLANTRNQTVFGTGNPNAKVMFLGEAPGADEDRTGEPFVGRAGQLLDKIIGACGWKREDLYICNILKCRPPGNRNPTLQEATNCREYLDSQIANVDPEYIVCWGTVAAQNLLDTKSPIGRMRGKFFEHGKAKVLCTYHPSYLLRNPAAKAPVWEDLQLLLREMGIDPKAKS